jgi:hypothetical protein
MRFGAAECKGVRGKHLTQHLRTTRTPLRASLRGHMIVPFAKEALWGKSTLAV